MQTKKIDLPIDRTERLKFISNLFPNNMGKPLHNFWKGGRAEALSKLAKVDPLLYGQTRNFLDGKVTRLSPYLRHGCITLKEAVLATRNNSLNGHEKLLFEFAWRDYWRQIWYANGNAIYAHIEAPKVDLAKKNPSRVEYYYTSFGATSNSAKEGVASAVNTKNAQKENNHMKTNEDAVSSLLKYA